MQRKRHAEPATGAAVDDENQRQQPVAALWLAQ
jgi:hypothetical protein